MTERTHILKIQRDLNPPDPRKCSDNIGTMVCWHSDYSLGDIRTPGSIEEFYERMLINKGHEGFLENLEREAEEFFAKHNSVDALENWRAAYYNRIVEKLDELFVINELYLYDHSGITMRCIPFACHWDSGRVGFIYVSKARAAETYDIKPEDFPLVRQCWDNGQCVDCEFQSFEQFVSYYLKCEVEIYNQYLTNEVYDYILYNENNDEIDSCGGFYGRDYKINGIADEIDLDSVKEIHWLEEENTTVRRQIIADVENLT